LASDICDVFSQFDLTVDGGADRRTRSQVVDTLGMHSADDCEDVREEIREHDAWDG
jgi:hypothetical protein